MKTRELFVFAAALSLGVACGDDSSPGTSEGAGTSTGTGGGTGPSSTGSADDSGTTAGSGNMDGSESSGGSSSGEPPPAEVTASGEVVDFTQMALPIPDANITVFGVPGISATSDVDGLFSIGPLTPNSDTIFVVEPSMDYWGAIIPTAIGPGPLEEDLQLAQIPTAFVDLQIAALEPQMPVTPDLSAAIMIVRLINNTAVMEGPTTVTVNPAPPPGTFYAPDAGGAPVLDQDTIEFAALPVIVYFNVPDAAAGTITVDATHPTRECTTLFPTFPTLGQHITLVDISCLPP